MDKPSPCDQATLRRLLSRHGFSATKRWGQNFLVDPSIPERIVEAAGIGAGHGVLEIGPGAGALTRALAGTADAVLAYEVDRRFQPILRETLEGLHGVTVLWEDFLKADLRADVARHLAGKTPVVCANLPYAVTTPILTKLIEADLFPALTVMVQKEVAERIVARPGTKAYGAFTLFVRTWARPEIHFDVPPQAFFPAPKVTSSVISLKAEKTPLRDRAMFFRVTRAAFAQRRKTLLNALTGSVALDRACLAERIAACGISPSARGETLSLSEFEELSFRLSAPP